jgi:hypothetical protein
MVSPICSIWLEVLYTSEQSWSNYCGLKFPNWWWSLFLSLWNSFVFIILFIFMYTSLFYKQGKLLFLRNIFEPLEKCTHLTHTNFGAVHFKPIFGTVYFNTNFGTPYCNPIFGMTYFNIFNVIFRITYLVV